MEKDSKSRPSTVASILKAFGIRERVERREAEKAKETIDGKIKSTREALEKNKADKTIEQIVEFLSQHYGIPLKIDKTYPPENDFYLMIVDNMGNRIATLRRIQNQVFLEIRKFKDDSDLFRLIKNSSKFSLKPNPTLENNLHTYWFIEAY